MSRLASAATRVSLKMLLIWLSVIMSIPVLLIGETKGVDVLGTGSVNDRTIGFDLRNPLRFTLLLTKFESTNLFKSGELGISFSFELCDIIGQLIFRMKLNHLRQRMSRLELNYLRQRMDDVKLFEATNEDEVKLFETTNVEDEIKLFEATNEAEVKLFETTNVEDEIKLFEATNVEKLRIKFIQAEILGK